MTTRWARERRRGSGGVSANRSGTNRVGPGNGEGTAKVQNRHLVGLGIVGLLALAGSFIRAAQDPTPRAVVEGRVFGALTLPAVVWADGDQAAPAGGPLRPSVIDQKGLEFVPRILPVVAGSTVTFLNSDPIGHNAFSASFPRPLNLGLQGPNVVHRVTFDRPGVVELLCNVHPEMAGYVIVLETPYFAMTDERGFYQLQGLPPGSYTVSAWTEGREAHRRRIEVDPGTHRLDLDLTAGSEK